MGPTMGRGDLEVSKLGYDLSKVSVQPRIREFGPELWLDLVLWACVEEVGLQKGLDSERDRTAKGFSRNSVVGHQLAGNLCRKGS